MGRPTNAERDARTRELNRNQLAFVVWYATPADLREPRSEQEFIEVIGVNQSTVWRWKKDPRIQDAIRFVVLQNAGDPLRVGQILDMLHEKALADKDREAAKVWLTATGVMGQFGRQNTVLDALDADPEVGFADFSTEQLIALREANEAAKAENRAVQAAKAALADTA